MANEKRLIDANAYAFPGDLINEPTVDAVEVVRCKDCKYFQYYRYRKWEYRVCEHDDWYVDVDSPLTEEDGFCFRGERRCE